MKTLFVDSTSAASVQALAGALFALSEDRESMFKRLNGAFPKPTIIADNVFGRAMLRANDAISFSVRDLRVSTETQRHFESICARATRDEAPAYLLIACMLMEFLCPDAVVFSPVGVGSGADCAALLTVLSGASVAPSERPATVSFASFAREFADEYGAIPPLNAIQTAAGADSTGGAVTCVLGERAANDAKIAELACNVDDMTPEALGFAMETFFAEGALEVYATPLTMKKSRPGVLLTVMCKSADRDKMLRLFFKHTTTLGVRESYSRRHTLNRTVTRLKTSFGPVRKKRSEGFGVTREKYEYEDLSRIAREYGISLDEARTRVREEEAQQTKMEEDQ